VETLSLSELKAQNEATEQPKDTPEDEYVEVDNETLEPIEVEEPEGLEVEEEAETDDEKSEPEGELEDWQKAEDDNKSGFIPSAEAKHLRLKNKDLKAQKEERDAELEELRQKVEALSNQPAKAEDVLPPRPVLEDYDYDEKLHGDALEAWFDKKIELKLNKGLESTQQDRAKKLEVEAANQARESAVHEHLNKASKLIAEKKITQDAWLAGDLLIRQTLDQVFPGSGNEVADQFVSLMESNGEGSEKAWFYLGRNPKALNEFKDKLMSDKTGASGVMYLAKIQEKASKPPHKKRSDAPKPAAELKGDAATGTAKSLKKQYDKAVKDGNTQGRIDAKRAAKKAGADVSKW
jgi:hypothetical protein